MIGSMARKLHSNIHRFDNWDKNECKIFNEAFNSFKQDECPITWIKSLCGTLYANKFRDINVKLHKKINGIDVEDSPEVPPSVDSDGGCGTGMHHTPEVIGSSSVLDVLVKR